MKTREIVKTCRVGPWVFLTSCNDFLISSMLLRLSTISSIDFCRFSETKKIMEILLNTNDFKKKIKIMDAEVDSRLLHYDLARCFTLQDL